MWIPTLQNLLACADHVPTGTLLICLFWEPTVLVKSTPQPFKHLDLLASAVVLRLLAAQATALTGPGHPILSTYSAYISLRRELDFPPSAWPWRSRHDSHESEAESREMPSALPWESHRRSPEGLPTHAPTTDTAAVTPPLEPRDGSASLLMALLMLDPTALTDQGRLPELISLAVVASGQVLHIPGLLANWTSLEIFFRHQIPPSLYRPQQVDGRVHKTRSYISTNTASYQHPEQETSHHHGGFFVWTYCWGRPSHYKLGETNCGCCYGTARLVPNLEFGPRFH